MCKILCNIIIEKFYMLAVYSAYKLLHMPHILVVAK